MEIKLIATDLDGTLLTNDKVLTEANKIALKKASERGVLIVPATGRPVKGVEQLLYELPFVRYVIVMNGAMVWDLLENKPVYSCSLSNEQALMLWDFMQKYETMMDVHVGGIGRISQYYYDHCDEYTISDAITKLVRLTRVVEDDVRKTIEASEDGVQKLNLTFKNVDDRNKAMEELRQFDFIEIAGSVVNNIEINHINATKGVAIKTLANHIGISLDEVMAFGDAGNDCSMIEAAGLGVAMGNAIASIKEKASFITLDNENSGVAYAVNKFVL